MINNKNKSVIKSKKNGGSLSSENLMNDVHIGDKCGGGRSRKKTFKKNKNGGSLSSENLMNDVHIGDKCGGGSGNKKTKKNVLKGGFDCSNKVITSNDLPGSKLLFQIPTIPTVFPTNYNIDKTQSFSEEFLETVKMPIINNNNNESFIFPQPNMPSQSYYYPIGGSNKKLKIKNKKLKKI